MDFVINHLVLVVLLDGIIFIVRSMTWLIMRAPLDIILIMLIKSVVFFRRRGLRDNPSHFRPGYVHCLLLRLVGLYNQGRFFLLGGNFMADIMFIVILIVSIMFPWMFAFQMRVRRCLVQHSSDFIFFFFWEGSFSFGFIRLVPIVWFLTVREALLLLKMTCNANGTHNREK